MVGGGGHAHDRPVEVQRHRSSRRSWRRRTRRCHRRRPPASSPDGAGRSRGPGQAGRSREGVDLVGGRGQDQAVGGRRATGSDEDGAADGELLDRHTRGRRSARRGCRSADRPHQAAGHDGRALGPDCEVRPRWAVGGRSPSRRGCRCCRGRTGCRSRSAEPPSGTEQKPVVRATWPPTCHRDRTGGARRRSVDLPTWNTSPLGSSAGAVEPRSASPALSWYQSVGANVVEQLHGRAQLEHAVAVVVGVAGTVAGAVAGRHPDVALGVDRRGGASHPHRALAVAGRRPPEMDGVEPSSGAETTSPW